MASAHANDPFSWEKLRDRVPVRSILASIAFANWFIFAGVTLCIGGDALRTIPSQQGFVVVSHGRETVVSEGVWLFSLCYTWATLLFTPLAFLLVLAVAVRRPRKVYEYCIAVFIMVWAVGWCYAVNRDAIASLADFIRICRG